MNNITNAYILEKMMYGLYNTAGRRTTYSFAIAIMDTITRTLEQRYDFLKYLLFKTQSDSNEVIKINSNINFEDPIKVGKELQGMILLCYEKTGDFCHRHLVAEWLREAKFDVEEIV